MVIWNFLGKKLENKSIHQSKLYPLGSRWSVELTILASEEGFYDLPTAQGTLWGVPMQVRRQGKRGKCSLEQSFVNVRELAIENMIICIFILTFTKKLLAPPSSAPPLFLNVFILLIASLILHTFMSSSMTGALAGRHWV